MAQKQCPGCAPKRKTSLGASAGKFCTNQTAKPRRPSVYLDTICLVNIRGHLFSDGTISPVCMLITLSLSSTTLGAWECGTKSTGGTFYATNPLRPVRPSSPPTPTSGSSSSENKVNTDAIVGSTVGGVGGLAIIGAAVFFFMRYRKKNAVDNNSTTTAAAQPVFQHYQSPHPMVYQHYQGSQQFYPTPPSESPCSPQQCGHAGWGQPPPGPAHLNHTVTQPVELG